MVKVWLLGVWLLWTFTVNGNPVSKMLERLEKGLSRKFLVEVVKNEKSGDFFELSSVNGKIKVKANTPVNAAAGVNWYLKYYCQASLSFCEDQLSIPAELPVIKEKVVMNTPLSQNFYMNYCTFSYTTAFWDWKRWEREIDLMALNGITTPMAMVGAEAVWGNTLKKIGYTDAEVKEFLCGPGYFGWLLMGNLEKIGGPLPNEWFTGQIALQKKILARMREYGMSPVLQGFYGMVPASLSAKYPQAHIVPQGEWNSLNRPPVLDPGDPLFTRMAKIWYAESEKLFGKANYFGGDLFHEGGKTGGINITEAARGVQQAMLAYNPGAVWVIQSWGENPKAELLAGLERKHTLVVDLCAEFWSNWKTRKGFDGFPWVWSHLTNYGGNIGLHGRLDAIAGGPVEARQDMAAAASMMGVSATPEGIEINPVVFDLANEMRWRGESPDVEEWLKQYAQRRYGAGDENLKQAWVLFHRTAYGTYEGHRRPSESVFCAPPSLKGKKITASAWSQSRIFYNPFLFGDGVNLFLQSAGTLGDCPTYSYDAVDLVRQYLADLGREAYYHFVDAYQAKDLKSFAYWSERFLQLMRDQDELLSSHSRFYVGRWLDMARAKSSQPEIQDLYEYNARLLIGTWTEEKSAVRDYAHKEWGGMIADYYLPRWTAYVAYLKATLEGQKLQVPDSFEAEKAWVNSHNRYVMANNAEPVKVAKRLFDRYYQDKSMVLSGDEITACWHSGKTLPVHTAREFPPKLLDLREDKGYNVLIDISHQCKFITLWGTAARIHRLGYRSTTSQASLNTVLDPSGVCRVRVPYDEANRVWPFGWYPNFTFHVVITEQGNPENPVYLPEEIKALEAFVSSGGGLVVNGDVVKQVEGWSQNELVERFGLSFTTDKVVFEGERCAVLAPGKEWEVTESVNGKPVAARRHFGKGRVYVTGSGSLFYYDKKQEQALQDVRDARLSGVLDWLCADQKRLNDEPRLPQPMGGGGAIFPELESQNGDMITYYAKNQHAALVEVATKDLNEVTGKVLGWLPSAPTKEPMYLVLSAGSGGGWAVNARVPKENGIISMSKQGIISIYAHELAHTLRGPLGATGKVAGRNPFGNSGEPHAGWFQGKVDALYNEDLRAFPNKKCDVFNHKDFLAIDLTDPEKCKSFGKGKDWQKIWYIWQKLDDRYGTTWYPRWMYVQHSRWSETPDKQLTWEESVEDMSIAVGEDLFPFFRSIGVNLKRKQAGKINYEGKVLHLKTAPIQPTAPGNVKLEDIGEYK